MSRLGVGLIVAGLIVEGVTNGFSGPGPSSSRSRPAASNSNA